MQVDSVRTNVFANVSAAQDAHQMVAATFNNLISARYVTAAARSTYWLGHMSDATLQQLSRDRSRITGGKVVGSRSAMSKYSRIVMAWGNSLIRRVLQGLGAWFHWRRPFENGVG